MSESSESKLGLETHAKRGPWGRPGWKSFFPHEADESWLKAKYKESHLRKEARKKFEKRGPGNMRDGWKPHSIIDWSDGLHKGFTEGFVFKSDYKSDFELGPPYNTFPLPMRALWKQYQDTSDRAAELKKEADHKQSVAAYVTKVKESHSDKKITHEKAIEEHLDSIPPEDQVAGMSKLMIDGIMATPSRQHFIKEAKKLDKT